MIIASITGLLAGSAYAQRVPVGERTSSDPARTERPLKEGVPPGAKDTRRVVQDFARCIVRRDSAKVAKYLESTDRRFRAILGDRADECLGVSAGDESRLSGQADSFRYALAEAYLVRKYREAGLGDLSNFAPLYPAGQGHQAEQGLGPLSECIIRKAPAPSWALLRTDAASSAEKAAFSALAPAMQECVPRGTTLKMQAFFMRGALADAYFRLSKAPRVQGAPQ